MYSSQLAYQQRYNEEGYQTYFVDSILYMSVVRRIIKYLESRSLIYLEYGFNGGLNISKIVSFDEECAVLENQVTWPCNPKYSESYTRPVLSIRLRKDGSIVIRTT